MVIWPRPKFCYFVIHAVTWTLADLAARTCRPSGANAGGASDGRRRRVAPPDPRGLHERHHWASKLAEAARLSVARVYQIHDGRR
jgi:hypothetical protein